MTNRRYKTFPLFLILCVLSRVFCQTELTDIAVQPELTEIAIQPELAEVATQPELAEVAVQPELTEIATQPELNETATQPELTEIATQPELTDIATETELTDPATETEQQIYPTDPTDEILPTEETEITENEAYPTDLTHTANETNQTAITSGIEKLPQAVVDAMSSREMRHHHLLWHNIRNTWLKLDNVTQQAIADLGWAPPRPSQNTTEDGKTVNLQDNGSGEDFLYMHREMIKRFEDIIANMSEPYNFFKWDIIPMPNDTMYPVQPAYNGTNQELTSSVASWKSEDVYWRVITSKEVKFKSQKYLKTITLGQLGSQIEYELHNGLHMRWSENTTLGLRNRPPNPVPYIDPKWDAPANDWLIDAYSSQNNPYFYKIHYWVDERVNDWMTANNITDLVWNNTWTGGPMTMVTELVDVGKKNNLRRAGPDLPAPGTTAVKKTMSHDMSNMHWHAGEDEASDDSGSQGSTTVNVMEELVKILQKAGVQYNIYDDIDTCEEEQQDWLAPEFSG